MIDGVSDDRVTRFTAELHQRRPLIHNITNRVMRTGTADAITASGGTHMTVDDETEATDVAQLASALVVNSATPDPSWQRAAGKATGHARDHGLRWVLDPVAVGVSTRRTNLNWEVIHNRPAVVKANASEVLALAGTGGGGHGPDSRHAADTALASAHEFARSHQCVVVVTGASDGITDGTTSVQVHNGAPVMARMVGSGCMLGAVIGCYLATEAEALEAAIAGVLHFNVSGEIAAERSHGPGTLYPALIDALVEEDGLRMTERAQLDCTPP